MYSVKFQYKFIVAHELYCQHDYLRTKRYLALNLGKFLVIFNFIAQLTCLHTNSAKTIKSHRLTTFNVTMHDTSILHKYRVSIDFPSIWTTDININIYAYKSHLRKA